MVSNPEDNCPKFTENGTVFILFISSGLGKKKVMYGFTHTQIVAYLMYCVWTLVVIFSLIILCSVVNSLLCVFGHEFQMLINFSWAAQFWNMCSA